jgi:hypothetical protein
VAGLLGVGVGSENIKLRRVGGARQNRLAKKQAQDSNNRHQAFRASGFSRMGVFLIHILNLPSLGLLKKYLIFCLSVFGESAKGGINY